MLLSFVVPVCAGMTSSGNAGMTSQNDLAVRSKNLVLLNAH